MDKLMKYNELLDAVLKVFPNATVGDDNDGQFIVYTNYFYNADVTEVLGNGETVYDNPAITNI